MTRARQFTAVVLGLLSAVLFAVGLALVAIWALDGEGGAAGLPELSAGVAALVGAALAARGHRALVLAADVEEE